MTVVTTYDPRSADLARVFLAEETPPAPPERVRSLALAIQQAIEDWFEDQDNARVVEEKP
jgi:hypothetical protein